MSNVTINQLPAANTIDPVNDLLPIFQNSSTSTLSINRNTYLGLASQPLGLTDSQSPTNKTFNNTNIITVKDGNFTLNNSSDTTKVGVFSLSGNTTGTTRTYTLPNASVTLASLTGTETLTNKTLTSPTINSPVITNASVTADAITGYTTSNSGTIYGGLTMTTGNAQFGGTLGVTGATTLTSTLSVGSTLSVAGFIKNTVTPVWQFLGYAQSTSTFNTSSGSPVAVTGLTVGVTIPTGITRVRVTVWAQTFSVVTSGNPIVNIYSGATSSALTTSLAAGTFPAVANYGVINVVSSYAPSAGSIYYTAALSNGAAVSTTLYATSGSPSFILVECC